MRSPDPRCVAAKRHLERSGQWAEAVWVTALELPTLRMSVRNRFNQAYKIRLPGPLSAERLRLAGERGGARPVPCVIYASEPWGGNARRCSVWIPGS